jgi:hypothetical protein
MAYVEESENLNQSKETKARRNLVLMLVIARNTREALERENMQLGSLPDVQNVRRQRLARRAAMFTRAVFVMRQKFNKNFGIAPRPLAAGGELCR